MRGLILAAGAVLAGALLVWLSMIAGQQRPLLLFSTFVVAFAVLASLSSSRCRHQPWLMRLVVGALLGSAASILSLGVGLFTIYGLDQFMDRFTVVSSLRFAFMSMGWLFGALVFPGIRTWQQPNTPRIGF